MEANELIKKKRYGDIRDMAEHFGVKPTNMVNILRRPSSKRHKAALSLLEKLIETREELIKS